MHSIILDEFSCTNADHSCFFLFVGQCSNWVIECPIRLEMRHKKKCSHILWKSVWILGWFLWCISIAVIGYKSYNMEQVWHGNCMTLKWIFWHRTIHSRFRGAFHKIQHRIQLCRKIHGTANGQDTETTKRMLLSEQDSEFMSRAWNVSKLYFSCAKTHYLFFRCAASMVSDFRWDKCIALKIPYRFANEALLAASANETTCNLLGGFFLR